MRSILIKGTYDSALKKITGYKGMCLNHQKQESWTIKFDNFQGIFGLILSDVTEGFGRFHLYYFPSPQESLLEKFSLSEAWITQDKSYIDKVRAFAAYPELLMQFHIATLRLHVDFASEGLLIVYESQIRQRVYAKDGVLWGEEEDKYIINPGGLDKDLPTFRLLLPFMNFLNTAITKITKNTPEYFKLFKTKGKCVSYDKRGVFHELKDASATVLFMATGYGKGDFDAWAEVALSEYDVQAIHEQTRLSCFLQKAPWYDIIEPNYFTKSKPTAHTLKPKLIVITGFLGSGKTNLLQHYIEYETEKNHFVGIIQNEIGKTGLDGRLIDYDYSLVELDEGCVCCSLAGQLRAGVSLLMEKISPDTILLETTGVANPFNLLSELGELEDVVEFESIVTVVDGTNALTLFEKYHVFRDQIRSADIILLNKTDLMSSDEIIRVKDFLVENNRCAKIIETIRCDVHPNLLQAPSTSSTAQIAALISEENGHHHNHVKDGISSIKVEVKKTLNKKDFIRYLQQLPKNILRLKGIVQFKGEKNQSIVQYVNGRYELIEQENRQRNEAFLVFIGQEIEKSRIQL